MVFSRLVEIGRVALINEGPDRGKLCVIVDVVDQRKALVDGPCSGVARQAIGFGKLYLLDFKIRIPHSARRKTIVKAYEKMDIGKKWEQSAWAKKLVAKAKKASITDFERFKVKCLKQQRARVLNKKFKELKKAQAVQS